MRLREKKMKENDENKVEEEKSMSYNKELANEINKSPMMLELREIKKELSREFSNKTAEQRWEYRKKFAQELANEHGKSVTLIAPRTKEKIIISPQIGIGKPKKILKKKNIGE